MIDQAGDGMTSTEQDRGRAGSVPPRRSRGGGRRAARAASAHGCARRSRGVGARLVVIGRDADRASDALDHAGGDGSPSSADVTNKADADRAIDAAMQAFGRVDVIVNAVGGGAGSALYPAEDYPEAEWDRMLDLNLRSVLLPTQAAVRAMIAGGHGGRVLHLSRCAASSGSTTASPPTSPPRARSTRSRASRRPSGPSTASRSTRSRRPSCARRRSRTCWPTTRSARASYKRIPLGRIAETDDVVGAVLLLSSDASAFITGQVLTLDGGLTACQ